MGSIARKRHRIPRAGQCYAEYDSLEFRVLRVDPTPAQGDLAVSTTVKSCVMVAVLPIMIEAEQYFSAESLMARSTLAGSRPRPFTTKCTCTLVNTLGSVGARSAS